MGQDTDTPQAPGAEKQKGDLTPEQEKLLNDLTAPIIEGLEAAGVNQKTWLKDIAKLTKAKSPTRIKVRGGVTEGGKLERGAKVIVKGKDEDVVEIKDADNQTRNAALQYIGKITQWQPPDRTKVEMPPGEMTLVYNVPKEPETVVIPDAKKEA